MRERQNQQLKASLEASRIRIENFCEYPAEALRNIEEPRGSVSGAMSGVTHLTPDIPEPENTKISAEAPEKDDVSHPALSASGALSPGEQEKAAPTAKGPYVDAEKEIREPAVDSPDTPRTAGHVPSAASLPSSTDPQPSSETPNSDRRAKKTWTALNRTKSSMELRIAGEGPSLTAEGRLLSEPLRYEVTLHGRWKINNKRPENELIKSMRTFFRNDDTVIAFSLASKPETCEVRQEDSRTVAVVIR